MYFAVVLALACDLKAIFVLNVSVKSQIRLEGGNISDVLWKYISVLGQVCCVFNEVDSLHVSSPPQVDRATALCSEMHNIREAIYENKKKLEGIGEDYQFQVRTSHLSLTLYLSHSLYLSLSLFISLNLALVLFC